MVAEPILKVTNLSVEFDHEMVLDKVSFSVGRGEVLAIVGPNGAGKSVLFRSLLGLVPHTGDVDWETGAKIGYVPQKLFIERSLPLTVREFLHLNPRRATSVDITQALLSVGLKASASNQHHLDHHIFDRPVGTLSGGEFQRIMIAWALIGNPDVLLFDEPTAGIDIGGEETIYNLLRKLQASHNLTVLLISHDLQIVYKYADQVICLNKKVVCTGIPREVLDADSLAKLYGEEATIYEHPHSAHHKT